MAYIEIKEISKSFGGGAAPVLDKVSFDCGAGGITALIGESGCGKTTLLRLLAGLETPDGGNISLNGRLVSGLGTMVPPEKRKTGLVFQNYALFPHLSVEKNILYGLKTQTGNELPELLRLTGLEGMQKRYPHELSGGQQQRVALARALAPRPDIMLLDEPFSNLDELLKESVRKEVQGILRRAGISTLLVTHDIQDAMAVADSAVVLKQGRLQQIGTPRELYERPENLYVAEFFGKTNRLPDALAASFGLQPQQGKSCFCRPESLRLSTEGNPENDGSTWQEALITSSRYLGGREALVLAIGGESLTAYAPAGHYLPGQSLLVSLAASDAVFVSP